MAVAQKRSRLRFQSGAVSTVLCEPALLQVFWEPVDVLVLFQHQLLLPLDIHEPTRVRPVHQLGATAVTVRIAVHDVIDLPDYASLM